MKKLFLSVITLLAVTASALDTITIHTNGLFGVAQDFRADRIKGFSSAASGTIALDEIFTYAVRSTHKETVTNIVKKDATYKVGDAMVAQTRYHTGLLENVSWWTRQHTWTNIVGSVTNVYTAKLSNWVDGSTTNGVVYTNAAVWVRARDVVATKPFTNITSRVIEDFSTKAVTNRLGAWTMVSGKIDAPVTNVFIKSGARLRATGTAVGAKYTMAWLFGE